MGIKGFSELVKKHKCNHESCLGTIVEYVNNLRKFNNWPFKIDDLRYKNNNVIYTAWDLSLLVNQMVKSSISKGNQKDNISIQAIFSKLVNVISCGIFPIMCFDGAKAEIKSETLAKRRNIRIQAENKLLILEPGSEEYYKTKSKAYTFSPEEKQEILILLKLMGVMYVYPENVPMEGEALCVYLTSTGPTYIYEGKNYRDHKYADLLFSDDSDCAALGAHHYISETSKSYSLRDNVKIISVEELRINMNLTKEQLINMLALMGTDNCTRFKDCGPAKCYEIIKQYHTIERFMEHFKNNVNGSIDEHLNEHFNKMIESRNYFINEFSRITSLIESGKLQFNENNLQPKMFQEKELKNFLIFKHGVPPDFVNNHVQKLKYYYNQFKVTKPNTDVHYEIPIPNHPVISQLLNIV